MRTPSVPSGGRWPRLLLATVLLVASTPFAAAAIVPPAPRTIHVSVNDGDDLSGTGSESDPYATIGRGMNDAESGDTVLVHPGTYSDEEFPVTLETGVDLISSDGPETTILDADLDDSVLFGEGVEDVLVEGFTVTRGAMEVGGGVLLVESIDVTLRSLEMTANIALGGGAVGLLGSEVTIEDSTMASNGWLPESWESGVAWAEPASGGDVIGMVGGALYAEESTVTLEGVAFSENAADECGGAVAVWGSRVVGHELSFDGNLVSGDEGIPASTRSTTDILPQQMEGIYSGGGLVLLEGSSAELSDLTFTGNEAMFGSGMHADATSGFVVSAAEFVGNFSLAGSLSHFDTDMVEGNASSAPTSEEAPTSRVDRCLFEDNMALAVSGIAMIDTPLLVTNSVFARNLDMGAVVWLQSEDSALVNSTVADNETGVSVFGPCDVRNSIVWGNEHGEIFPDSVRRFASSAKAAAAFTAAVVDSEDFDGCDVTYTDSEAPADGTGNISADPAFADPENGDYRLTLGSPAVDAGTPEGAPAWDFDGLARPVDGDNDGAEEFDMGAFELGRVDRIAGVDRYETSVKISRSRFDSSDTVVLATGRVFADGLAGAGLAGIYDAPLLLTRPDGLPSVVASEIRRLGATRAVILGGEPAVGGAVVRRLRDMGLSVTRIGGADRYETAALIAERIVEEAGEDFSGVVFFARGDLFPDALAVSPAAYALGAPTLLVLPGEMPAATVDVLNTSGIVATSEIVVAGSEAAVGPKVAEKLPDGFTRIGGADRYATAAGFSEYAAEQGWSSFSSVGIATGEDFADALTGGAALGSQGGVLLLTSRHSLSPSVTSALANHAGEIASLDILGGPAAIDDYVRSSILGLLED